MFNRIRISTCIAGVAALVALSASVVAQEQWVPNPDPAAARGASSIVGSVNDPVGDTFNAGPDLTLFSASGNPTSTTFVLQFAGPIQAPPGTQAGNEVVGFIDIDADQNAATGIAGGAPGTFCPTAPSSFGMDFSINLGSFDPINSTVAISDSSSSAVGVAPITYGPDSITVTVPNGLIGGDPVLNSATVIGNIPAPTDCAPDNGAVLVAGTAPAVSVPAIGNVATWMLLSLVLAAGILVLRRI